MFAPVTRKRELDRATAVPTQAKLALWQVDSSLECGGVEARKAQHNESNFLLVDWLVFEPRFLVEVIVWVKR
jgi:hypothetical protein